MAARNPALVSGRRPIAQRAANATEERRRIRQSVYSHRVNKIRIFGLLSTKTPKEILGDEEKAH
jgi:hypothetical protein